MNKQREYRVRKDGKHIRILRVNGLLDTDQFSFECSMAVAKAWIIKYEQWAGNQKPVILACPYVPFSRAVPMLNVG